MSLGNATFGGFFVGRASRLPSNDLPTQARRPRNIQKSKSKLLLVLLGVLRTKGLLEALADTAGGPQSFRVGASCFFWGFIVAAFARRQYERCLDK